jgi:tetratricopeptide (TPR) repeat protein
MGSRTHKQAKRFSVGDLFQRARRSLEKQDFKQAYKDAKVCFQQEPSEPHRRLLERAWLSRAMAQHRAGLASESRESAQGLLDFGVTDTELRQQLAELLVAVGLLDRALGGQSGLRVEVCPELLASAADRSIAAPATAPKSLPEVAAGARQVRAALDALLRDDEPASLEQLKDIPRSSPFADWRWFVRGLAAYYRGEAAEMQVHWERLEPGRLATRIAAPLRLLARAGADAPAAEASTAMGILERAIVGESLAPYLREFPRRLAEDDVRGVLNVLRRCRPALLRVAPELLGRVERLLCASFVRAGDRAALTEFVSLAAPPPMDPNWNRAWAMLFEHPECDDVDEAERFWRQYVADLAALPGLEPSERATAQALVWERIGRLCAECSESFPAEPYDEDEEQDLKEERARAVACFGEAIRLAPALISAHESLAEAYRTWGQEEEAAASYRQLLEHSPEHLDALMFLFQHHFGRNEPMAARDYALKAWRLKPANPQILEMAWIGHMGAARQFALEGKFEEGRAEFAAAERLPGDHGEPFHLLARKAIFEYKAGDTALGQRLVEEAIGTLEEPAPALLVLLVEAARYDLPYRLGGIVADLEYRWQRILKHKKNGKTAGRFCRTMLGLLMGRIDYPGRSTHLEQVRGYVDRCGRVRWEADDLRAVCMFLKALPKENRSSSTLGRLRKLVRQGYRKFPEAPDFPYMMGCLEIERTSSGSWPFLPRWGCCRGRGLRRCAATAGRRISTRIRRKTMTRSVISPAAGSWRPSRACASPWDWIPKRSWRTLPSAGPSGFRIRGPIESEKKRGIADGRSVRDHGADSLEFRRRDSPAVLGLGAPVPAGTRR